MKLSTGITILIVGIVFGYTWAHKAHWNSRQAFCEQIAELNAKTTPKTFAVVLRYCKGEEKKKEPNHE